MGGVDTNDDNNSGGSDIDAYGCAGNNDCTSLVLVNVVMMAMVCSCGEPKKQLFHKVHKIYGLEGEDLIGVRHKRRIDLDSCYDFLTPIS